MKLTRRGLVAGGVTLALADRILPIRAARADSGTVTIAYNVGLPAWDPTVGPSAVNPTIQAIYQSVFDQYIGQNPDLSFTGGWRNGAGTMRAPASGWMCAKGRCGTTAHRSRPTTSSGR